MSTKKKSTKSKARSGGEAATAEVEDPRAPLEVTPKNVELVLAELSEVLAALPPPEAPVRGDLVDALIHGHFLAGLPCGYAQEARERIAAEFVDRNEFRLAEAFETFEILDDLGIPDCLDRCRALQLSVQEIYNDQNDVNLDYLREASISERKSFFQRIPAIGPEVTAFLVGYVDLEEVMFSDRSTTRTRARLGLDGEGKAADQLVDKAREMLAPFGHVPLRVHAGTGPRKSVVTKPVLSPACLLMRLSK